MKLATLVIVTLLAAVAPVAHDARVLTGRRFQTYYVLSAKSDPNEVATNKLRAERRPGVSDPRVNLSQVARDEGWRMANRRSPGGVKLAGPQKATAARDGAEDERVLHGVSLCLNLETNVGYALVRDSVPGDMLSMLFELLRIGGWHPVEDEEGIEPHDFEDGSVGVQVWLYRLERPIESILRDMKAT